MILLAALVLNAPPLADAWVDRAALGADRLAVAAVDEQAGTRPLKQLWWSGEGQQVLELLDHRACIGSLAQGCLQGSGLPAKALHAVPRHQQGRMRWDWSNPANKVLAFEIVGTQAVLWAWKPSATKAAAVMPTLTEAALPGAPAEPTQRPLIPSLLLWGLVLALAILAGRLWGRRGSKPTKDWQGRAKSLEEELERERLRSTVHQGQAERERDALRLELTKAGPKHHAEDLRRIAELEDRLQRFGARWQRLRGELEREAEVSQRDATRFLAPLQQLGVMLRQVERRMGAVDEIEFAEKLQQRRLGLQAFERRLRDHFSGAVTLDQRSWQGWCDELDELLGTAVALPAEQRDTEAKKGPSKKRSLQVLRGGR